MSFLLLLCLFHTVLMSFGWSLTGEEWLDCIVPWQTLDCVRRLTRRALLSRHFELVPDTVCEVRRSRLEQSFHGTSSREVSHTSASYSAGSSDLLVLPLDSSPGMCGGPRSEFRFCLPPCLHAPFDRVLQPPDLANIFLFITRSSPVMLVDVHWLSFRAFV